MDQFIATAITVFASLLVTFVFNYFVGLPKKINAARKLEQEERKKIMQDIAKQNSRLDKIEETLEQLPVYRQQSIDVQNQLKSADIGILELCSEIKRDVIENRSTVLEKLERLEKREKNTLRAKIIDEYRLYTDSHRNPMLAWSEMEAHSFWTLVEDYESLGGNDYVHGTVIPEMHRLRVIRMTDLAAMEELFESRRAK